MLSRFVSTARSGIRTMGSATAIITEGAAIPRVTFKTSTRVEGVSSPAAKRAECVEGDGDSQGFFFFSM